MKNHNSRADMHVAIIKFVVQTTQSAPSQRTRQLSSKMFLPSIFFPINDVFIPYRVGKIAYCWTGNIFGAFLCASLINLAGFILNILF